MGEFIEFAKNHPDKTFFVTLIGCGIAGYSPEEMAPLFERCYDLENVCLPSEFWDIIGWPKVQQPHYDLLRFLDAQEFAYTQALRELKEGRKQSHWIWYIFPQQKGLGHSHNANYYGLMARVKPEPILNMRFWVKDSVNAARRSCYTRVRTSNTSWEVELM